MKKKVVTALAVLTILKGVSIEIPRIVFAVGEDDKIVEKDKEINELRAQESEVERNINVIEEQIAALKAEINRLQEELKDAQEELNRLEREVAELNDRINRRHRHIEKNARCLQLHKGTEWLNYLKVVFNKKSNWSQKISALTSISKVMSSQKNLIEQQERDYTVLENKKMIVDERVALIFANQEKIKRDREELEQCQADLEVQRLDLEVRRASAESEKQVFIVRKETAQRAAKEVEERQKREFEEHRTAQLAVKASGVDVSQGTYRAEVRSFTPGISSGGGYSDGMQCTDYATAKTGIGGLGNASQWTANAQNKGYNVSKTPKAGDVAVFAPGQAGASSYGHVGVVDSVNSDGSFNMSESNYNGSFNKRTVSSVSADGFISSH